MRRFSFFALLFVACGSGATFTPTNPPPHTPEVKPPATVQFYSTDAPFRDYVEIGELKADSSLGGTAAMNALREEAARRGCDGVMLKKREDGKGVAGTCLMFK